MKKTFKKIAALLLAGALAATAALPALAEEAEETEGAATTHTITNHTIKNGSTGHTYEVYQVFTGNYDADSEQLQNMKYGTNAKGTTGAAVSQADAKNLADIAKKEYKNDQEKIDDLEEFVNFSSTPVEIAPGDSADFAEGYYVIKDKDDSLKDPETYTLFLFDVLSEDMTITPKSGTVEHEKHVDDQNDSDSSDHSELKDSADYDIGDDVPYTLTATLPENYHDYESYYIAFVDDMSAGLTYNDDAKIYFGEADTVGTAIEFAVDSTATSAYTNGTVYTYKISDLKTAAPALTDGAVITIKYTAKLNSNAVIGSAGNPNEYKIIYNNNPNNSGEGKPTNETPWDVNIVFTYKAIFNKVDPDGKPLTGADFTLYKKVDGEWVDVTTLGTDAHPAKAVEDNGEVEAATFSFTGLDAGEYKLKETTVPTGYNGIDPIEFKINAEHDLESDDPTLKSLTATDGLDITGDVASGAIKTDIENKSGSTLPSTGGMGTTIFYVIGGILVLAAVIILVSKRRVQQ